MPNMSEQTSGALRAWFKRVEPLYPELFNTAYAVCPNYEQAEQALQNALLEAWLQGAEGSLGFRERLRGALLEEALRTAKAADGEDFTWPGFTDLGDDPIATRVCREGPEIQRLLLLRYGVGLSPRRIAEISGMTAGQVKAALNRFEPKCRRALARGDRARYDALMTRAARRQLASQAGIPHPAAVYRAFEAEASSLTVSEHRVTRAVYRLLIFLMALICAVLFWLFAVLVQPPAMEAQGGGQAVEATAAP